MRTGRGAGPQTPFQVGECKHLTPQQRQRELAVFLRKYGDDLPPATIRAMTSIAKHKQWATICDARGELAAVGHFEPSDWYACIVKGLAVKKELRGQGLGRKERASWSGLGAQSHG